MAHIATQSIHLVDKKTGKRVHIKAGMKVDLDKATVDEIKKSVPGALRAPINENVETEEL